MVFQGERPMDEIEIELTPQERDLILNNPFAGKDLTKRLQLLEIRGNQLIAKYDIEELNELLGVIAADAIHTWDENLKKRLDKLFEKLSRVLEKYK